MQILLKQAAMWLFLMGYAAFSLSVVSVADTSDEKPAIELGVEATQRGDFGAAFKLFLPLAEAGDPEAQHNLAMLYRAGRGVEKDLAVSARWFRRAAEQGVADAQYYLGHLYDTGEGVQQSAQYAFVWYRKAAEQGQGLAQINLGVMYANGQGVEADLEEAYLWFHVAAAQGYKAAFENRSMIAKDLQPERLDTLQERMRQYFQKYVMPFERPSSARSTVP
jgi:TPR repeat protein